MKTRKEIKKDILRFFNESNNDFMKSIEDANDYLQTLNEQERIIAESILSSPCPPDCTCSEHMLN